MWLKRLFGGKSKESNETTSPPQRTPLPEINPSGGLWGATVSKNRLTWVGAQEEIVVGRYQITNPITFVSKGCPDTSDASCIDLKLRVGVPVAEPKGALGYWPEYFKISPNQRANYLTWLATGRKAPLNDIGYAFIFFYGLERRVLIDKQDTQSIVVETLRLLKTYQESRSFQGYLTNFVAYAIAATGLEKLSESWYRRIFEEELDGYGDDVLGVALAWLHMRKKSLNSNLAFRISQNDPRSPKSVVLKRLPEKFQALFRKKFESRFGENFLLKAARRDWSLSYHPASPSLMGRMGARSGISLPDVLGLQSQFKPLIDIWTECVSELKAASSKMAKGLDLSSREAYEALPPELKSEYDHPDKPEWQGLIARQGRQDGIAIVPASLLARMRGIEDRPKLTLRQSLDIATGALDVGFTLTPDPWTIQRPYLWNELIAVVPVDGYEDPESDNFCHAAALMLELGMGMAAADGKIERDEVVHVSLVLKNQFRLSKIQALRLEAFRSILVKNPPSLTGIGKRIQRILSPEQRGSIGHFLVGVAASDGHISKAERIALKAVYRAMGLSPNEVDQLVTRLAVKPDAPVVIQEAAPTTQGESIPSREPEADEPTVVLDMSLVAQIARETMAVADMIGKAMGELGNAQELEDNAEAVTDDESPNNDACIEVSIEGPADEKYEGLSPRFHKALDELLTQEIWSGSDFENLARKHGLMPSGMLEEINSWSDEHFGDFLIEDQEPYCVQKTILEKRQ